MKRTEEIVKGKKIEIYKLRTTSKLSGQVAYQKIRAVKKEIAREFTKLNQAKRKG